MARANLTEDAPRDGGSVSAHVAPAVTLQDITGMSHENRLRQSTTNTHSAVVLDPHLNQAVRRPQVS